MKIQNELGYINKETFDELDRYIKRTTEKADAYLQVIADLIRFNTLLSVARSGTGHLGASLSMIELLAEVYFRSFHFDPQEEETQNRDIFILSKGHGAPSLYATLSAKGYFPTEELDYLRRLGHLEGHCDISTHGIESNTGSLAIGLSKAVGYAIGKKRFGLKGNVIVIAGDGELQEGQCWEAFLSASSFKLDNLYVVIDDNKVQTDQFTQNIMQYGKLTEALTDLGFFVLEGKGRNVTDIHKIFNTLKTKKGKPKLFWCHTFKGQGVHYMEYPNVLKTSTDKYIWHNKAPDIDQLNIALAEILKRIQEPLKKFDFEINLDKVPIKIPKEPMQSRIEGTSLVGGFSEELVKLAGRYTNMVVIDGDLEEDCGFIKFHKAFPERFFEMGIMEQHMVATTCALSRLGYIPVISTYAAFLTSRANEQLYNLASERTPALVIGNMAGVIPATPGKSHQAFRDISCIKNIPGFKMYQPVSEDDSKNILIRYFEKEFGDLLFLRLSLALARIEIPTPDPKLPFGVPQVIRKGKHIILCGIGPVILGECISAALELEKTGVKVEIWNHPWLTDFDYNTYAKAAKRGLPLLIIEDHYFKGGFGESMMSFLAVNNINFPKIRHLAIQNFPQTGYREEALKHFGLDKKSIINAVKTLILK